MSNVILTDADGVLLNWRDSFDAWMMRQHGIFATGDVNQYDQIERYQDPEIWKKIVEFNGSANIGWLPPLYDSVKYVRKIYEELGMKFTVITSLSKNPYAQKLRTQNLINIFGKDVFEEFIYLDTGEDKDVILGQYSEYYPGAYWIEDKVKNAIHGAQVGLQSLLMKHPHIKTEDTEGIPKMSNWRMVYETIGG